MEPRLNRVSWGVGAGILLAAAFFIRTIIVETFRHMDLMRERFARYSEPWHRPYPIASVVQASVFILAEALALWLALMRPRAMLWFRASICGLVAFLGGVELLEPTDSPPTVVFHGVWLLSIAAAMIVTTVGAGVASVVRSK